MIDKFRSQIYSSDHILITSHTSPDPDAVSSLLLLGLTLEHNYPKKHIRMVLEEEPSGLEFMTDYKKIEFKPLILALEESDTQLFILVDANSYNRISRHNSKEIREFIESKNLATVIIDHHEPDDQEQTDVFNTLAPAAAQEVYELCFEQMGLSKPLGYADITMTGIYSDTGGFAYLKPRAKKTLLLAAQLLESGTNIEIIKNRLNQFSEEQIKVMAELMSNLSHEDGYNFSFLRDEFVDEWVSTKKNLADFHTARNRFVNDYIRNIEGRTWGFVVSQDPQEGEGCYSVSFRSTTGNIDVHDIARRLDGGGHKAAAGANIQAIDLQDALTKVRNAIEQLE